MNTITLHTNRTDNLILQIRTRPFELVLNDRITELTIHTPLSQEMVMGEILQGGYTIGGTANGVLLWPMEVNAGYAVGGDADGYVTHYLSVNDGYAVDGAANLVLLDYMDGFSAGYTVGGRMSTVLTRYRYVSEADTMLLSDMDTMKLSDIEFITLE